MQTKAGTQVYGGKARDSRTTVIERQREAERHPPLVNTSPQRRARLLALHSETPGNDAETQAERLLRALRGGPVTTHEARHYLDIMSPASRVHFLLHSHGHDIQMRLVMQALVLGKVHRIAEYTLIRHT
ncbi:MAG: helix-turn-helix domain-containing protein [Burkholderiaceae bacterium]